MAIYTGHFSPMPANFEPPRPGTMPKRAPAITIGLNDIERTKAQRRSEAPGHLTGCRHKRAVRNNTKEQSA